MFAVTFALELFVKGARCLLSVAVLLVALPESCDPQACAVYALPWPGKALGIL